LHWAWWYRPLTRLTNNCPSMLWHCWLGNLTCKMCWLGLYCTKLCQQYYTCARKMTCEFSGIMWCCNYSKKYFTARTYTEINAAVTFIMLITTKFMGLFLSAQCSVKHWTDITSSEAWAHRSVNLSIRVCVHTTVWHIISHKVHKLLGSITHFVCGLRWRNNKCKMADDCHFEHDKTRLNYAMDYKILTKYKRPPY